jgi:hypothetical protein
MPGDFELERLDHSIARKPLKNSRECCRRNTVPTGAKMLGTG